MADNIIDFNQHKQKKQSAARAENTLSLESLMERLSTLPDNESLKRELDYRAELVAGLDNTDK